jgi:hypothetical protein
MLLNLRSKKTASRTFIAIFGVGQHAGMSDDSLHYISAWVGQHTGIRKGKPVRWEIISGQHAGISTADKRSFPILQAGQHAGMVGQHKQEWWVNMRRNLQANRQIIMLQLKIMIFA